MVRIASISCSKLWRADMLGVPSRHSLVGVKRRAPRLRPPNAREDTRSLLAVEAGQPMVERADLLPCWKLLQSGAGLSDMDYKYPWSYDYLPFRSPFFPFFPSPFFPLYQPHSLSNKPTTSDYFFSIGPSFATSLPKFGISDIVS